MKLPKVSYSKKRKKVVRFKAPDLSQLEWILQVGDYKPDGTFEVIQEGDISYICGTKLRIVGRVKK